MREARRPGQKRQDHVNSLRSRDPHGLLGVVDACWMAPTPPYLTRWVLHPEADAHVRSAAAVARFALTSPDLTDKHRSRLLNDAIWYRTEAASKIKLRFRSAGVLTLAASRPTKWRSQLRHDHVDTRASLIKQMTERPEDVEAILRGAVSCLVTVSEHDAVSLLDAATAGWDRYLLAKVDVYDFSADPPRPFIINGRYAGPPSASGTA